MLQEEDAFLWRISGRFVKFKHGRLHSKTILDRGVLAGLGTTRIRPFGFLFQGTPTGRMVQVWFL